MKNDTKALIMAFSFVVAAATCAAFTIKAIASGNNRWTLGCLPVAFATSLIWQWLLNT